MTRGRKLGVLLAALIVISAAAYLTLQLTAETEETVETTPLLDVEADDITALSWTYDGETLSFTLGDDESWAYDGDDSFPLRESRVTSAVDALAELTATKTLEDPADLSEYGLDEPAVTVTATAGEESWTLLISEDTSMDGECYLSIDDGNVYLVDSSVLDSFSYGLYDMVTLETIPDMDTVESYTVETDNGTLSLVWLEENDLTYSADYQWFLVQEDGTYVTLDPDLAEDYVGQVTGLSWSECVDYQADEDSLAEYGLDDPSATVTVTYLTSETNDDGDTVESEETFVLELGSYTGDGSYARIQGSNMVYLVDGTVTDALLYTDSNDLLPDDVLLMDWDTVDSVDITLDGATYHLDKSTQEVTDEETEETTEETVWTLTDEDLEVDLESVLTLLDDMESTGTLSGSDPELGDEITFVFNRNTDSFQTVTLTFSQYDSSSCLVTLDGETRLLVDRTSVDELIETFQSALEGDSEEDEESEDTETTDTDTDE